MYSAARLLFRVWLFIAALNAQTGVDPAVLARGVAASGELAAGQSQEYLVALQAGDYSRVSVDQRTINVAVTVFAPDGSELVSADSYPIGENEIAEIIAAVPGSYRVRLTPSAPHAPRGRYAVTLEAVEPATEPLRNRAVACREFARAMASYLEGTRDAMMQSIDHLANALAAWRAAGHRVGEVQALVMTALVYAETGNRDKTLDFTARALRAAQDSGDRLAEARALDALGQAQHYFGDRRKAIEYYEQALPLMRAAGARAALGATLSNLAVSRSRTGDKRRALEDLDEALSIFRELQDRRMMADVTGNIGVTQDNLGEFQKALENHQLCLSLRRELEDRPGQAISWNNIGSAYSGLAAYQKALDAYTAALEINRSLDQRRNSAINLNNIAWVYGQLADHPRALAFYQESLALVRQLNDGQMTGVTLKNIAETYADFGDHRKAVELHNQALQFRRLVGDTDGEANSLNYLGKAYANLGDSVQARAHFERALAMHRSGGNRYMMAAALRNLGELERKAAEYGRAQGYLDEALETSRAIRDPNGESAALAELAQLERSRGNLAASRQRLEESLRALESVRLAVASPKLRASYFASARDIQELNIEVLMRLEAERPGQGLAAAALEASERGRARSLLEMLGEGAGEIRRGVDPALLAREHELQQVIAAKAELRSRLLDGRHTDSEARALANELDALAAELDRTQSGIRGVSPGYAALIQPAPLHLKDIQHILDDSTVLLEYALGKERSFLWVVTPAAIATFDLPPRAEIESTVKRLYELLTARNRTSPKETPASRAARLRQADRDCLAAAATASRMLLAPAAAQIAQKRLLIVGGGVVDYLPFATLPDPSDGNPSPVPLIVHHEIVTAPSASVMAVLRAETAGRKPAAKSLAVLADPVFSPDDPRILRQKATVPAAAEKAVPAEASRAASNVRGSAREFLRLRFSRAEADEIARLTPPETTLKALDFDASRDTVLHSGLGDYRIVHFATHSLLDNQHPELSGVVLSLVDRDGHPRNGFLRLYDIYNLRLGSDLVVLSACQTALGGEIKGEGLIGLTRGFLYAGAPRVVAALWEIDDRTTAEVMKRFYRNMLVEGETPAGALRSAQVSMWKARGWEAPFYWAGFTFHGEWR